jgi:hypothetical protein
MKWSKFRGWWLPAAFFLILLIFAAVIFNHWTVYTLAALTVLISSIAWHNTAPSYVIKPYGVRFIFISEEEIPDKSTLEYFIWKEVLAKFAQAGVLLSDDVLKGVDIYVHKTGPTEKGIYGRTWPNARYSEIFPREEYGLLDTGVLAYELSLHICHALFPNRLERDDIEWMRARGII